MTPNASGNTRRVLVADDEPGIRRLLTAAITAEGYVAVDVPDGREAFRILQSDANFSAAILDIQMPFLTGLDLIRYMQTEKRLQRIPVMLITGETDLALMSDGLSAGATAFLPKTFTFDQLQSALRMLLDTASRRA